MVSLSASVMAHPIREAMVSELVGMLGAGVPVSWDVGPISAQKQKRWCNGRKAWEMATGDWHVVLQDDVTVCADFLAGLELALDRVPDHIGIVQPYIGTIRPLHSQFLRLTRQAAEQDASWIQHRSMSWGVAIAVRIGAIGPMLDYCERHKSLAYDSRIARYFHVELRQDTWYTWPSLVDHRPGPSLVGHGRGRVAHRLHKGSALDLDWDGPVVLDQIPVRANRRRRPARPVRPIVRG